MRRFTLFLLTLFVFFVVTKASIAAEMKGLSIFPKNFDPESPYSSSWFIYNLLPGEVKKDSLVIQNNTEAAVTIKVYPVDATTTSDGAFALKNEDEQLSDIGGWIKLDKDKIDLPPGNSVELPFTLSIPHTASVGDHLGGIIIENVKLDKFQGINLKTRVGVRMYETVPGKLIRKLDLTQLTFRKDKNDHLFVDYFLKNSGNVRVEPKAKISISYIPYGTTQEDDIDLRTVLPNNPIILPYPLKSLPPLAIVRVKTKIDYADNPQAKIMYEASYTYWNKKFLTAVIVGIIVLLGSTIIFKKNKK